MKYSDYLVKNYDFFSILDIGGCIGSILDLKYKDDSFDAVQCMDVLENLKIEDVAQALSEITRIARKYLFLTISESGKTAKPLDWWMIQISAFGKFLRHKREGELLIFTRDGRDDTIGKT